MPSPRALLLIAALFLLIVLLRLPAAWVVHALPAPLVCESPAGTAWAGSCGILRVGMHPVANVDWDVLPGELLHGKLGLLLRSGDAALQASGRALISVSGQIQGYDVVATLAVPNALTVGVPPGWRGTLELDLPRLEAQGAVLQSISGVVRLRELQQALAHVDYGSFEWQLAGALRDAHVSGTLRDLGGPVRLQGTLTVGLAGDYELNAKIAAAAGASEPLQQSLQQLGPADAQGFHPMLSAGTL